MDLLVIFGPPAVGKMTVGREVARITGYKLCDLRGLVFTFVWAIDDPGDKSLVDGYVDLVESRGGTVRFVELYATQEERLARNATPARLDAKRSKRDVEASNGWLLDADERSVLNTSGGSDLKELVGGRPRLRIDNTDLAPDDVADRIVASLDLSRG